MHQTLMKKNEMIDNLDKNMTGPIFPKVVQSIYKLKKSSQNIYNILNKVTMKQQEKTNGTAQIYLIQVHWLVNIHSDRS